MENLRLEPLLTRCDWLLERLDRRRCLLAEMRTVGGEIDRAYAECEASSRPEPDLARLRHTQAELQARIEALRVESDAVLEEWWAVHRQAGEALAEAAKRDSTLVPVLEHFSGLSLPGGASSPLQILQLRELLRSAQERTPGEKESPAVGISEKNGLLTARDVSALLGISDKTVYRFAKDGRIPYVRLQSSLRFRRSEVEQWIESRSFKPKRR